MERPAGWRYVTDWLDMDGHECTRGGGKYDGAYYLYGEIKRVRRLVPGLGKHYRVAAAYRVIVADMTNWKMR